MRIQVLSDLHLEFGGAGVPPLAPEAEIVVLAGDLAPAKRRSVRLAARAWKGAAHILYVPGNHEYYGSRIAEAQRRLALDCAEWGVTLLDTEAVTIGHVRFIGATLWTDFRLDGELRELYAHDAVGQGLNDFCGSIRGGPAPRNRRSRQELDDLGGSVRATSWTDFTTREAAQLHARDRAFIEAELAQAGEAGLETVVVTHHAPSPRSIHPRLAGDPTRPGYASDLEAVIRRFQPALWVHGHLHDAVDFAIGRTRVLANPRGYNRKEARDFTPDLVVEV